MAAIYGDAAGVYSHPGLTSYQELWNSLDKDVQHIGGLGSQHQKRAQHQHHFLKPRDSTTCSQQNGDSDTGSGQYYQERRADPEQGINQAHINTSLPSSTSTKLHQQQISVFAPSPTYPAFSRSDSLVPPDLTFTRQRAPSSSSATSINLLTPAIAVPYKRKAVSGPESQADSDAEAETGIGGGANNPLEVVIKAGARGSKPRQIKGAKRQRKAVNGDLDNHHQLQQYSTLLLPITHNDPQTSSQIRLPSISSIIPNLPGLQHFAASIPAQSSQLASPHSGRDSGSRELDLASLEVPSFKALPLLAPDSANKVASEELVIRRPIIIDNHGQANIVNLDQMDVLDLIHDEPAVANKPNICRFSHLHPENARRIQLGELPADIQCSKRFTRKSDCGRHESIHTGIRPHKCPWEGCGKSFIQKSAMTVHYRTHTGERPHVCDLCSKSFADSSSLARHRKTHYGVRAYPCTVPQCVESFRRKIALGKHLKLAHPHLNRPASLSLDAASSSNGKSPKRDDDELDVIGTDEEIIFDETSGHTAARPKAIPLLDTHQLGRTNRHLRRISADQMTSKVLEAGQARRASAHSGLAYQRDHASDHSSSSTSAGSLSHQRNRSSGSSVSLMVTPAYQFPVQKDDRQTVIDALPALEVPPRPQPPTQPWGYKPLAGTPPFGRGSKDWGSRRLSQDLAVEQGSRFHPYEQTVQASGY